MCLLISGKHGAVPWYPPASPGAAPSSSFCFDANLTKTCSSVVWETEYSSTREPPICCCCCAGTAIGVSVGVDLANSLHGHERSQRRARRASQPLNDVENAPQLGDKKKVSISYGHSGRRNVVIGKYVPCVPSCFARSFNSVGVRFHDFKTGNLRRIYRRHDLVAPPGLEPQVDAVPLGKAVLQVLQRPEARKTPADHDSDAVAQRFALLHGVRR